MEEVEIALSGCSLKLVQPGKTRWLSHARSVAVVLKQYESLLITLEHEHKCGGDLAIEAGGLLLDLRKTSTFTIMGYLDIAFQELSKLSVVFQSSCNTLDHTMAVAKSTIRDIDINKVSSILFLELM